MYLNSLLMGSLLCFTVALGNGSFAYALQAPETSTDAAFKPQSLTKLAVIVANSNDGSRSGLGMGGRSNEQGSQPNRQRLVEDVFVQSLLELGHVVVARSDLKAVLKEQSLGQSGLTDSNTVAVGKLLNVPAVLVVKITEYASETQRAARRNTQPSTTGQVTISARLVSVETGTVWWQGKHTIKEAIDTAAHLQFTLGKVSDKLARAFPTKQPDKPKTFEPAEIKKLALIMESNSRPGLRQQGSSDQLQEVEDKLSILLGNKGYTLVSRTDLQTVMQEKQFQASGLTEENVTSFGKLLNVPAVLVVRITDSGPSGPPVGQRNQGAVIAAIGARLVSVETGEVLWCRTYIEAKQTSSKLDQSQVLTQVTKKVGDLFPSRK